MSHIPVFHAGKKEIAVTSVTLVNNTAKTIDTVVPASEKWQLLNIKVVNCDDVARNVTVIHYKEAAKTNLVKVFGYIAALGAAGVFNMPSSTTAISDKLTFWTAPQILHAGETISVIWAAGGASTGATDADGLVIEYLRLVD